MTANKAEIDWEAVKGRLFNSSRAFKKAMSPGTAYVKSIYRKRAGLLALRKAGRDSDKTLLPVLSFWIGEECYAITMNSLKEVLPQTTCTPIPGTPAELLGVVNLHGEIRPVVNASVILGLAKPENGDEGYIVFMRRGKGAEVGLRVDRIDEVRLLREDELTVPGSEASGLPARFIKGVSPDTLILLDTEEILSLNLLKDKQ